jgi:hypothetical protein
MAGPEPFEDLRSSETQLVAERTIAVARCEADDPVIDRITWLVAERLERLGRARDGMTVLYRDPRDGRLWEYDEPHLGSPNYRLTMISPGTAAERYDSLAPRADSRTTS